MIPAAEALGTDKLLRVRCQVRSHGGEHTFLPTFKMDSAPAGQFLAQRRHRISPGTWTDIDDHFEVSLSAKCALRFYDRSVSAAPSRLEIRRLAVTEREPPRKLLGISSP